MNNYLTRAIKKLQPNSEFSYSNDDYSTIIWDILEGNPPTETEINAAIEQIKVDEITQIQKKAELKASALAKLAALGLTEDEAKAVIGA